MGAAGSHAGVGDLPPGGVRTPALADGGVALRGLVGPALVALGDVVADGRPGAERGGEAGGGCPGALSVALARRRLALWEQNK